MLPPWLQEAAEGQSVELSTDRVESTIPKGDGGTWVYPSSQMFFNALQRKGKSAEGQEQAMDAVVAIHNNMNELTWQKVCYCTFSRLGLPFVVPLTILSFPIWPFRPPGRLFIAFLAGIVHARISSPPAPTSPSWP